MWRQECVGDFRPEKDERNETEIRLRQKAILRTFKMRQECIGLFLFEIIPVTWFHRGGLLYGLLGAIRPIYAGEGHYLFEMNIWRGLSSDSHAFSTSIINHELGVNRNGVSCKNAYLFWKQDFECWYFLNVGNENKSTFWENEIKFTFFNRNSLTFCPCKQKLFFWNQVLLSFLQVFTFYMKLHAIYCTYFGKSIDLWK